MIIILLEVGNGKLFDRERTGHNDQDGTANSIQQNPFGRIHPGDPLPKTIPKKNSF